ncbi:50S ribosomal protein L32 [Bifidobacterium simiarum]|uniref:Large ribosomal subunit protein bL32 n=1 Tax=Bifidobacterium simiarum TaxID=2045441 RepID=A0A2M9HFX3_9BIFI|nr:50S ribosomal protein L32 [Bifidobacterium simiarum]MBT1166448.1 50S ribosomal protein L32 [Bifidobacterium simiarum]PJM75722.1 50S ribosomal protein L32 [Bifidobacterium simiarum]
MALPKYKTSRANTHTRRSAWKTTAAQTAVCKNCGEPVLAHQACPSCGSYRGRTYRAALKSSFSK